MGQYFKLYLLFICWGWKKTNSGVLVKIASKVYGRSLQIWSYSTPSMYVKHNVPEFCLSVGYSFSNICSVWNLHPSPNKITKSGHKKQRGWCLLKS